MQQDMSYQLDMSKTIAERRAAAGMTQIVAAIKSRISLRTYQRCEYTNRMPRDADKAKRLAKVLGITPAPEAKP